MRNPPNPLSIKALEIVRDELRDEEKKVIRKVLMSISSGEFTPDMAVQKWYEIRALRMVPARLKRQNRRAARLNDAKPVDTL